MKSETILRFDSDTGITKIAIWEICKRLLSMLININTRDSTEEVPPSRSRLGTLEFTGDDITSTGEISHTIFQPEPEPFLSLHPNVHKRSLSSYSTKVDDGARRRLSYDSQRIGQAFVNYNVMDVNLNPIVDYKNAGDRDNDDHDQVENDDNLPADEIEFQFANSFASPRVRTRFLRKVLVIVGLQLLVVTGWTLVSVNVGPIEQFVREHVLIVFTAMVVYCTLYFAVGLMRLGRTYPANLIILLFFTATLSYICGYVTLKYTAWSVLMSLGATAVICLILCIVTFVTKLDITGWGIYLTTACCLMMLYAAAVLTCSYILLDSPALSVLNITGGFFGATLVSVYLLYDLQMMIGGRSHEIDPEEWLFAAMAIFYDLVMVFVYLLQIIGIVANRPPARAHPNPNQDPNLPNQQRA